MAEINRVIDKIESMITLTSFESTLAGLMIKELFFGDDIMKEKYEKFRSEAYAVTAERFQESGLSDLIEYREKLNMLEKGLDTGNQTDGETDLVQELNTELKHKFEKLLFKNLAEIKSKLSDTKHDFNECMNLINWYEKRNEDIMNILRNRTGSNIQENDDELIGYLLQTNGERPPLRLKSNND